MLGNGFGGFISVALAARHGAKFERLVASTNAPERVLELARKERPSLILCDIDNHRAGLAGGSEGEGPPDRRPARDLQAGAARGAGEAHRIAHALSLHPPQGLFRIANRSGTRTRGLPSEEIMRTIVLTFCLALLMPSAHAAGNPSDAELTRRVKSALNATIGVRAREIEIYVLGGVVSLHGQIATAAARDAAVSATERTPGVRGVSDNLSVGGGR